MLPFLSPEGALVSATTAIQPVTAALSSDPYRGAQIIERLFSTFDAASGRLTVVPDEAILKRVGSRKALNIVLLASAVDTGRIPLTLDELRAAIEACVKPEFVELNLKAVDAAVGQE